MAQRMTAILDTFDASSCRRSLGDVASRTGLATSTAHRILDQLLELGWVQHDDTGYALGWRARRLSERLDPTARLREAAAPHIEQFVRQTPFVVHLAVLEGPYVRYLDKAGGRTVSGVPSRVGGLLPAHLTAVGKAMLAHLPTETLVQLLDQAADDAAPALDRAAIHRELARIRIRGGVASDSSSTLAAVSCVGAPIFGAGGEVIGALSLCADKGKQLDLFRPALRERARRISARLGGPRRAAG
jgi:DNA-binding IclR family transcriptional regulator